MPASSSRPSAREVAPAAGRAAPLLENSDDPVATRINPTGALSGGSSTTASSSSGSKSTSSSRKTVTGSTEIAKGNQDPTEAAASQLTSFPPPTTDSEISDHSEQARITDINLREHQNGYPLSANVTNAGTSTTGRPTQHLHPLIGGEQRPYPRWFMHCKNVWVWKDGTCHAKSE